MVIKPSFLSISLRASPLPWCWTAGHRRPAALLGSSRQEWWRRRMEMEMDFPSTPHTGCKRRSQSGVTLPGQTPGIILLPLPSSSSQLLYFHQASSPCPPHCSLHTYQYLLQREIFTALLPLLALYKGTHISFGVFERNNTHKHLPVPGHRSVCRGGQQGTEENNETPTQRHDSRAGWPGGAG